MSLIKRQENKRTMLRAVVVASNNHPDAIASVPALSETKTDLGSVVTGIKAKSIEKGTATKGRQLTKARPKRF